MAHSTNQESNWPRRRLLVRSIISSTMPIGWTWAALTALIPYFWIGHGSGSSAETLLGATRATWLSLHVWSSIAVGILTIVHILLNRRGVARSYRVVSGIPNRASSAAPRRWGVAWVGVVLLVAISIGGGYWFASVDNTHGSGSNRQITAEQDAVLDVGSNHGHGNGHG